MSVGARFDFDAGGGMTGAPGAAAGTLAATGAKTLPSMPMPGTPVLGLGRSAEVFAWRSGWVLKAFYANTPRAYVAHEYRIAQAVSEILGTAHAAQAPPPFHIPEVGEPVSLDPGDLPGAERFALAYSAAPGLPLTQACALRHGAPAPHQVGERLAALHRALHAVCRARARRSDQRDAPDAAARLPVQETRLREALGAAPGLSDAHRTALLGRLEALLREAQDEPLHLCHGDFHPFNILEDAHAQAFVIDWVTAEWGHPLCDVAKTALRIRFSPFGTDRQVDPAETARRTALHDAYLQHYFGAAGSAALTRWLPLAAAARLVEGALAAESITLQNFIDVSLRRNHA